MQYFHKLFYFGCIAFLTHAATARAAENNDGPWDVVVEHDVMIPMRDGVQLATSFPPQYNAWRYLPSSVERSQLPLFVVHVPWSQSKKAKQILARSNEK